MLVKYYSHPTATIDDGADIGAFTSIWHYSHIEGKARVGENCNIGQNIYVGDDAIVGNACRLGNGVSVFSHVELADYVFCAPFMVFTHISFPRAAINRHSVFKKTYVQRGATLGGNCTILPGVTVGEGSFIAAGAVLTGDSKPWALMIGIPARHTGWVSAYGERIPLPVVGGAGEWVCKYTGDRYFLKNDILLREAGKTDILSYKFGEKLVRLVL